MPDADDDLPRRERPSGNGPRRRGPGRHNLPKLELRRRSAERQRQRRARDATVNSRGRANCREKYWHRLTEQIGSRIADRAGAAAIAEGLTVAGISETAAPTFVVETPACGDRPRRRYTETLWPNVT